MRRLPALAALLLLVQPAGAARADADPARPATTVAADSGIGTALVQADRIRRSDPAAFREALAALDQRLPQMGDDQRQYFDYLRGWERVFAGDYARGIAILAALRDGAADPLVRFRAGGTLVNAYSVTRRYEEAFEQLNGILDQLPQITDAEARAQVLSSAAQLYGLSGETELAIEFAERSMREPGVAWVACLASQIKYDALERGDPAAAPDPALDGWIARCIGQREEILAGLLRVTRARMLTRQGRHREAVADLEATLPRVATLDYAILRGLHEVALAEALYELGEDRRARAHALAALGIGPPPARTEVGERAFHVLYRTAKRAGDDTSALAWHEQYEAARAANSDNRRARQLAYQKARHEARARRLEIEGLARRNEVLQLQQELVLAAARTQRLAIALLLLIVASVLFWAWRIKRSQVGYMRQAQQDALTGIASRQHFMAQAAGTLATCRRLGQPAALLLIDLDHFKQINDLHGHGAGDEVLRGAVAACRPLLGPASVFGRLGGEEFAALLPDTAPAAALAVAQACRSAVEGVTRLEDGRTVQVSASFGIANAEGGNDLQQLLIAADAALYEAKRQGRNRVVVFEARMAGPRPVPKPAERALEA